MLVLLYWLFGCRVVVLIRFLLWLWFGFVLFVFGCFAVLFTWFEFVLVCGLLGCFSALVWFFCFFDFGFVDLRVGVLFLIWVLFLVNWLLLVVSDGWWCYFAIVCMFVEFSCLCLVELVLSFGFTFVWFI